MTQSARKYTDIYNAQGHSTAVEHTIDKHFKQIHDDAKKACMNAVLDDKKDRQKRR